MRFKILLSTLILLAACERAASAQGMLVASVGRLYGNEVQASSGTWAIGVGGGGAHAIGSELEYHQTNHFTKESGQDSKLLSLMASVFVSVPANKFRPYGIFGYGFIRQRTAASTRAVLSNLSNNDVGYSAGGGLTFKFSKSAGVRVDLRHFKVRKADGVAFQRMLVGIVLGG